MRGAKIALPYCERAPAHSFQEKLTVTVALDILGKLALPKCWSRLRIICKAAAAVAVPKAAVDEYRSLKSREDNVRPSGKPRIMQPIANALGMKILAYLHLRLGVLPFDR